VIYVLKDHVLCLRETINLVGDRTDQIYVILFVRNKRKNSLKQTEYFFKGGGVLPFKELSNRTEEVVGAVAAPPPKTKRIYRVK